MVRMSDNFGKWRESGNSVERLKYQHRKYIEQQLLKRKGDFVRIINKPGLKHGIENWILKLNLDCTKERDVYGNLENNFFLPLFHWNIINLK